MKDRGRFSGIFPLNRGGLNIAGLYLILGILWIAFSDTFVASISSSLAMQTTLSELKGWGYVIFTAILLYWLIQRETSAVREQETQLRLVTDAMPAMIAYIDADRRYHFTNRAYRAWFGKSPAEMEGRCIEDVVGQAVFQSISPYVDSVLSGKAVSFDHPMAAPSGSQHFFHATYVPDISEEGQVKGFFSLVNDITARRQAEAEREQLLAVNQRQKALLDAIFEADPSGLAVLVGSQMRIVYANPAYRYMTPDISLDPIGQPYARVWPPEAGVGNHAQIRQVLEDGRPFKLSHFERIFPDGARRVFKFQGRRIVWEGQMACLLTLWDVTEQEEARQKLAEELGHRRQAEAALAARNEEIKLMTQQLWQASKLATMGELAASVAHEINNPLAILSLRVENLESHVPVDFPWKGDLAVMGEEIERMAGQVSNLLRFSRQEQPRLTPIDVTEELQNTLELVHALLTQRRIEVREEIAAEIPPVNADRQQVRQLFLNLITNASDAMPDGGVLQVRVRLEPDGSQVVIELQDSGIGISPEDLPHVVDPFFTTKPEGKGTGLGLAISRRIVEENHGSFQITSPGKNQGVNVRITFPRIEAQRGALMEGEIPSSPDGPARTG